MARHRRTRCNPKSFRRVQRPLSLSLLFKEKEGRRAERQRRHSRLTRRIRAKATRAQRMTGTTRYKKLLSQQRYKEASRTPFGKGMESKRFIGWLGK